MPHNGRCAKSALVPSAKIPPGSLRAWFPFCVSVWITANAVPVSPKMTNLRRVQLDRTYIVNATRDLTEQKKAERNLRLFEEKFAKAFRASPGLMLIVSLKEGRFIEVHEAFERQLGYLGIPGMPEGVRQLGGGFQLETGERGTSIKVAFHSNGSWASGTAPSESAAQAAK
jgi:hypothetical protein